MRVRIVLAVALGLSMFGVPAHAAPDFYAEPSAIPPEAGTVIAAEPVSFVGQVGQFPGVAQRVKYSSTLADGSPVAVTGTYLEPTVPYSGGPTPTVVIGPGTQGQGDQCAPSRQFPTGGQYDPGTGSTSINYEGAFAVAFLTQGIRVLVTDYVGLGTPGIHTYVNRIEQGHALIDGARAALELAGHDGPVGFWGHSQGGGAAASAAELVGDYAPELNVAGTYASAPPADLDAVLRHIDGTGLTAAIGFAINGFVARYPELAAVVDAASNDRGKEVLNRVSTQCLVEARREFGGTSTASWTKDGRPLADVIGDDPIVRRVFDDQRIGNGTPSAPVLVNSARNDDFIPTGQAQQLVADWCSRGASVSLYVNELPLVPGRLGVNHLAPAATDFGVGLAFMRDRFAGVPAAGCGS
ncbi:alpha/beta fold hydrolase [Rhodococcoides kyotonense]|uniref:Secretory lipase n=1 Tax=Rhodococcoides kyotonense TaxID=398843 RepID=A0A239L5Q9_9NOCA|nr:alpha/beta fold hydrolase [Rhodococcus kyotonensis]SNT25332.1 Secretory lipase [Rhodococcus kyotonensis]